MVRERRKLVNNSKIESNAQMSIYPQPYFSSKRIGGGPGGGGARAIRKFSLN